MLLCIAVTLAITVPRVLIFHFSPKMEANIVEAAREQNLELVKKLIKQGVDVNEPDEDSRLGYNALIAACHYGHLEIVKCLIEEGKADIGYKDNVGCTALHRAAKFNRLDVVKYLIGKKASIDEKEDLGRTPLWSAAFNGRDEILEFLLERGAKVEVFGGESESTPLKAACQQGHLNCVEILAKKGKARIDAPDTHGRTPFYMAVLGNHLDVVKFLVRNGADVEAEGREGRTALWEASINGHLQIVKYLLSQRANVEVRGGHLKATPLIVASQEGFVDVVTLLIIQGKADLKAKTLTGYSALHTAASNDHVAVMRCLLANGMDNAVNERNRNGETPLYVAANNGSEEAVRFLISEGAKVDIMSDFRQGTPLMAAAFGGHIDVVKVLVEDGQANVLIKSDYDGESTALSIAIKRGESECVDYLQRAVKRVKGYFPIEILGKGTFLAQSGNRKFVVKEVENASILRDVISILRLGGHQHVLNVAVRYKLNAEIYMDQCGHNLERLVDIREFDDGEIFDCVSQICRGLRFAHKNSIVHGNLKP